MPYSGYFSHVDATVFKNLNEIAKKSNTTVYISNCLPDDIREQHKPVIMFCAKSN
jgi:hypothetical protein